MTRYGFNIRTRLGQRVDNIHIMAATSQDAERRLRQMYVSCEIIERREQSVARRHEALNVGHVIGLVSGAPSAHKAGAH